MEGLLATMINSLDLGRISLPFPRCCHRYVHVTKCPSLSSLPNRPTCDPFLVPSVYSFAFFSILSFLSTSSESFFVFSFPHSDSLCLSSTVSSSSPLDTVQSLKSVSLKEQSVKLQSNTVESATVQQIISQFSSLHILICV